MIKWATISFVILAVMANVCAQIPHFEDVSDECEISIAELPTCGKNEDEDDCIRRIKVLQEEKFLTPVHEEETTFRVLPIKDTNLFVTGIVFYTDESLVQQNGWDSMRLSLIVSRKGGENALEDYQARISRAEYSYYNFDTGKVSTVFRVKNRRISIFLQCHNPRLKKKDKDNL